MVVGLAAAEKVRSRGDAEAVELKAPQWRGGAPIGSSLAKGGTGCWCPPGRASTIDCRFGRGGGSGWRAESLRGDNTEACCEVAGEQSERTGQRRATGWDGFWAAVVVSGRLKSRTPRRAGLGVGRAVGGSISVRAAAGG